MRTSESINELAGALAKAQGDIEGAAKDSANPFFKSKYADLSSVWEACRVPLSKNGLAVIQLPRAEGNVVTMETRLIHSSGQWIEGELTAVAKDDGPQSLGSVVTYLRRYMLQSVTGVAPEDDDGNAAQGQGDRPKAKQVASQHGMKTADQIQQPDSSAAYKKALDKITAAVREGSSEEVARIMNVAEDAYAAGKLTENERSGIANECTIALRKIKAMEKEPNHAAA